MTAGDLMLMGDSDSRPTWRGGSGSGVPVPVGLMLVGDNRPTWGSDLLMPLPVAVLIVNCVMLFHPKGTSDISGLLNCIAMMMVGHNVTMGDSCIFMMTVYDSVCRISYNATAKLTVANCWIMLVLVTLRGSAGGISVCRLSYKCTALMVGCAVIVST